MSKKLSVIVAFVLCVLLAGYVIAIFLYSPMLALSILMVAGCAFFIRFAVCTLIDKFHAVRESHVETVPDADTVLIPRYQIPGSVNTLLWLAVICCSAAIAADAYKQTNARNFLAGLYLFGCGMAFVEWRRSLRPYVAKATNTSALVETNGVTTRFAYGAHARGLTKIERDTFMGKLKRLILFKTFSSTKRKERIARAMTDELLNKIRSGQVNVAPSFKETSQDVYARFWKALSEFLKEMRATRKARKLRKRIEERPIRLALEKKRRARTNARVSAIDKGVAPWKARIRELPLIGIFFGSNETSKDAKSNDPDEKTHAWRKPAGVLLGVIGIGILLTEFFVPKIIPVHLLGMHFLFLSMVSWAWFTWKDCKRFLLRPLLFGVLFFATFFWVATIATQIGLELKQ